MQRLQVEILTTFFIKSIFAAFQKLQNVQHLYRQSFIKSFTCSDTKPLAACIGYRQKRQLDFAGSYQGNIYFRSGTCVKYNCYRYCFRFLRCTACKQHTILYTFYCTILAGALRLFLYLPAPPAQAFSFA